MPQTSTIQPLSRTQLVDLLRAELLHRAGPDKSICAAAAEQGIFCRGFKRYTDAELFQKYEWIARRRPYLKRDELEAIADRWQLTRQEVEQIDSSCDVQQKVHDTCGGWDDFTNEDLVRFYREMTGRSLVVR
jgi:hypothetical protein